MVAHTCKRTVQEVKRKGFTCGMRYRHRCKKVLYSCESRDPHMLGMKEKSRIPNILKDFLRVVGYCACTIAII